jgi:hypothetical protein
VLCPVIVDLDGSSGRFLCGAALKWASHDVRLLGKMGKTLIDEVPDARLFIARACQSWEKYKRFPVEDFIDVRGGVLATSGVDLQNESFAPEGLYQSAEQIRQNSLWLMHEHNPLVPPLGRVLAAKAFYAPESQLYFVAGVLGLYDASKCQSFSSVGCHLEKPPAELSSEELEGWTPRKGHRPVL